MWNRGAQWCINIASICFSNRYNRSICYIERWQGGHFLQTIICHNGGGGFRQREQGYHIPSVGRRCEDSLFSWVGTDGCHLCPGNNSVRVITALRPSFCSLYLHAAPPAIRAFAVSALARETAKLSCIRYRYPHIMILSIISLFLRKRDKIIYFYVILGGWDTKIRILSQWVLLIWNRDNIVVNKVEFRAK